MRQPTTEKRILNRIRKRKTDVFLRSDFKDLAGYDQVGRTLRGLAAEGKLVKLGYGLYGRAAPSVLDGSPAPVKSVGKMATEALARLGVRVYPSAMERSYNTGKSTQVPAGRVLAVDKRIRRKIGVNGVTIRFERVPGREAAGPGGA
jgi:Family of unknown function (DUF6088)